MMTLNYDNPSIGTPKAIVLKQQKSENNDRFHYATKNIIARHRELAFNSSSSCEMDIYCRT